jgi:hypothetical protein
VARAKNNDSAAAQSAKDATADNKDAAQDNPEAVASGEGASTDSAEHDSVLDEHQVDPSAIGSDEVDSHSVVLEAPVTGDKSPARPRAGALRPVGCSPKSVF